MPQTYYSVVTLTGQAKIAAAISGGPGLEISNIAAGDGNGAAVTPVVTQPGLVREVWRGPVVSVTRDPAAPTQVIVRGTIPGTVGPTTIRELALFASDGSCIAVANWPATEIAGSGEGAVTDIDVRFVLLVDSAAEVNIHVSLASLIGVANLLRPPFIAVDAFADAPPSSPAAGALVVVSATPTGAFAAIPHRLAQYTGAAWSSVVAPVNTIVGNAADGIYYRRTSSGWVPWFPSQILRGLARAATDLETDGGTEDSIYISPRQLARKLEAVVAAGRLPWDVIIHDEKTAGSNAGDFSAINTWDARELNTIAYDSDTFEFTLAANRVTLAEAGTYLVMARAPVIGIGACKTRLRNITAGTTILNGANTHAAQYTTNQSEGTVLGVITVAAGQALELQQWSSQATVNPGSGKGANTSGAGLAEIFTQLMIRKL